MTAMLIIFAWLLLPALALFLGIKLYVPWFIARQRELGPASPGDELAVRRAIRIGGGGDPVSARRHSA